MSEIVGVVGATGSGKSTSIFPNKELDIIGLDPKSNFLISVAGKPLPLKGWKSIYTNMKGDEGNMLITDDAETIIKAMRYISKEKPDVKTIVIDDFQYLLAFEFMAKAMEKGFEKFSLIAKHAFDVLNTGRSLREDLMVFVLTHSDEIQRDFETVRKMKTIGRLLDDKITLEGLFTVLLYAHTEWNDKTEEGSYYFITNRTNDYPSKSPVGMFQGIKIPNDLGFVAKCITEYNN